MKKILCMFAGLLMAAGAGADTILIDYNDGGSDGVHDASVNAGDFDSDSATTTAGWNYDLGTGAAEWIDNLPSGVGSDGNIVLGAAKTSGDTKVIGIDTGATIADGQTFDVSFMWRDAWLWDTEDSVSMVFFYTDTGAIDGTATDVLTFTSTATDTAGDWDTESATGLSYDVDVTSAVGQNLFVRFDSTASENEYARLDNVSVTVIPEPATIGMLGLGTFLVLAVRRNLRG